MERLDAIQSCPKNILFLSSFDFSLYLYPNTYRLLKNPAAPFYHQQLCSSKIIMPKKSNSASHSTGKRAVYRLEVPKVVNYKLDVSTSSNEALQSNSEQYEYDRIESPQKFPSNLMYFRNFRN